MPPLFRELQEMQAKRFAYKFCIPTFMLRKFKLTTENDLIKDISLAFKVTYNFARNTLLYRV